MSDNKHRIEEVKREIEKFRREFGDNPIKHMKEGTWFAKVVQRVLTEHANEVNAEFFIKKYPGLDKERIANKLIETTSQYAGITGSVAAAAVTASELSTLITGGWSWAVLGASLIGEISYTAYLQLKLVYDISVILDAKLDQNDPEDMLTVFWYALGINIWEDVTNTVMKVGPRSVEYLGRKALRAGVRDALQKVLAKLGGQKLAQKLTEKAILRLAVPGINMPIAYLINKKFTKQLGKSAISNLKHRGIAIRPLERLMMQSREFQLYVLPTVYHVGISDEPKDISSLVIEMQDTCCRKLCLTDGEENIISNLLDLEYDDFCQLLSGIDNIEATENLLEIAISAYALSKAANKNLEKIKFYAQSLNLCFDEKKIIKIVDF